MTCCEPYLLLPSSSHSIIASGPFQFPLEKVGHRDSGDGKDGEKKDGVSQGYLMVPYGAGLPCTWFFSIIQSTTSLLPAPSLSNKSSRIAKFTCIFKKKKESFLKLTFSFFLFAGCHAGPNEKRLLLNLLDKYNTLERPVANESEPVVVSFGLTLMQIIDVVRDDASEAWQKFPPSPSLCAEISWWRKFHVVASSFVAIHDMKLLKSQQQNYSKLL